MPSEGQQSERPNYLSLHSFVGEFTQKTEEESREQPPVGGTSYTGTTFIFPVPVRTAIIR